ncbi:Uma2 family endonuclease [Geminocystis sp. GBBB08]|uniref:Uma2 family endonuclease n=1 Tax=Geminocystis sp. GBBB08 TaxID=2604140 RepID=UPI0027E2AAE4|nr:Uma2 family endonuclease [Geminocystis sp. GBBB08]MBL1209940.1 Uma2 family endonuclease [Geminocystis sp. GBBB08]
MVQTLEKTVSFEEYLALSGSNDYKCEFVNGELIIMPPASGFHALIMRLVFKLLEQEIERLKLTYLVMPGNVGVRISKNKARIPDLMILSPEQCTEIKSLNSAIIESSPFLVIEIVSKGNSEDDYRYKRSEYATMEIPEYWIIDPFEQKISILLLVAGFYDVTEFKDEEIIKSALFPELNITVNQVLNQ